MKYGISVSEGCIASPGGLIYYKLARTSAPGRRPLIIFSHEIGCTHARGAKYARPLGEYGCHLLTFDFLGGGAHCRGGVPTTEMTVLTELRDLEAVLDAARAWDFADPERIYLMGASQGGFVSAACAARRAGQRAGLHIGYGKSGRCCGLAAAAQHYSRAQRGKDMAEIEHGPGPHAAEYAHSGGAYQKGWARVVAEAQQTPALCA